MDLNPATRSYVMDVSEANFMAEVVEASMQTPVIVDFWAPWCGPCNALGPALEKSVNAQKGKVKMAKVNADENQAICAQLRVQSLPTVFAFHKGQPVDAFQGALPQSEIDAFVEKTAALSEEEDGLAEALVVADEMFEAGEIEDASQTYSAIIEEDASRVDAYIGLAKCHLAGGAVDTAEAIVNGIPAEASTDPRVDALVAQISLAREAEKAGPLAELVDKVEADPTDMQARLDLAIAQHAADSVEDAITTLLDAFRMDREWNEGAIKAQLFKIFDSLPANDQRVLEGRRKLSSIIFA